MTLAHPDSDQIELANVLTALGDETRLAMIGYLARNNELEMTCGQFYGLGSKTALSYHLAKLREAGVVNVRPQGTKRLVSLRRADLDGRFPGFLDSIMRSALAAAQHMQERPDDASAPGTPPAGTDWD
ncbi:MAG: helix-turn-helix transcriptional regulator [Devosia sp.]|nr:helix-turn-helix transcriptional regulator [Devosia sp.]